MPTATIYADSDSEFQNDSPNFNNGASQTLAIGEEDFTSTKYRAVIHFPVTTYIPPGSIINSAILYLDCYADASNGTGRMKIYKTTSSWGELTVTWNTQPSYDSTVLTYTDIANGYTGVVTFSDFTALVQGWLDGTISNYGFFTRITETTTDNENDKHFKFRSRDYTTQANRPRLVVDYTPVGGAALAALL